MSSAGLAATGKTTSEDEVKEEWINAKTICGFFIDEKKMYTGKVRARVERPAHLV